MKMKLLHKMKFVLMMLVLLQGANALAQKTVTGTILSGDDNTPMPGVSVVIKGTGIGTVSDANGKFSLAANGDETISFSFIGYIAQDVALSGRSVVDVILKSDVEQLGEVVVVGYGSVKKSDVTGSISVVSAKDLGDRSATSIGDLLQGRAAGVEVTNGNIRVRGVTSLNGSNPSLYVIDGFIEGDPASVHPSDIESIEVLKDASATAIYGARGANGVIIITTKKGNTGPPKISFNIYSGVASPNKKMHMLNSNQYMDLLRDIELNGGTKAADLYKNDKLFNSDGTYTDYATTYRTDWQDQMFRTGTLNEYSLSLRGGSEFGNYSISGAYNGGKNTNGNASYKNFKLGANSDWKLFKGKLKISEDLRLQGWMNQGSNVDIIGGLRMPSYSPVVDPNALGGYAYVTTTKDLNDAANPMTDINLKNSFTKGMSAMINFKAELKFLKDLTLTSSYGVVGNFNTSFSYIRPRQNGNLVYPDAQLDESMSYGYKGVLENFLTYSRKISEHNFTVMVGNNYKGTDMGRDLSGLGKGYINNEVQTIPVAKSQLVTGNGAYHTAWMSYFGRINYSFRDKYLLSVSGRADASDKFSPSNRWAYFPAAAIGWKINEENFMQSIPLISQLKLTASFGKIGNDGIPQYTYFSNIHSNVSYAFPSHGSNLSYNGTTINSASNPGVKWELLTDKSVSVDAGVLDDKFVLTAAYFNRQTNDILFPVPMPPALGFGGNGGGGDAIINAATLTNKGVELMLTYKQNFGDLKVTLTGNMTFVKNKVISLGNGRPYNDGNLEEYKGISRTEAGHPVGYFYGYKVDHVYKNQAEVDQDNQKTRELALQANPGMSAKDLSQVFYDNAATQAGDIRFQDLDGDGKVTDNDRTQLGSPIPTKSYGFSANLGYKGFDFFMNWTGKTGNSVVYEYGYWMEGMIRPFNSTTKVLNRWTSESDPGDGMTPRAVKTDPAKNLRMSDRFVYSGAYLRLNLISLGYTIPKSLLDNAFAGFVKNVRVYVSSDNLLTVTKYPGYNPEIGDSYNLARGIDYGSGPVSRTFRGGIQVGF